MIIESNDAEFYEDRYPIKLRNGGGSTPNELPLVRINEPEKDIDIEPRRSKRARVAKDFGSDY